MEKHDTEKILKFCIAKGDMLHLKIRPVRQQLTITLVGLVGGDASRHPLSGSATDIARAN